MEKRFVRGRSASTRRNNSLGMSSRLLRLERRGRTKPRPIVFSCITCKYDAINHPSNLWRGRIHDGSSLSTVRSFVRVSFSPASVRRWSPPTATSSRFSLNFFFRLASLFFHFSLLFSAVFLPLHARYPRPLSLSFWLTRFRLPSRPCGPTGRELLLSNGGTPARAVFLLHPRIIMSLSSLGR